MESKKRQRASYAAALAAVTALLLTACGSSSTGAANNGGGSVGAFPTSGTGEVHIYNWTDYIDPDQITASSKRYNRQP